ncbi:hypothetical protein LPY66_11315 [Dehalobacter sp. DCM]|uniref:hypothetical protein n=1 Tax=Dehalobacter sp. DCM TaxID=2907827 RepID=UPI0030815620|nr:hypothetical protein LPY66_11315 [Dehalobacter sp. DCM]
MDILGGAGTAENPFVVPEVYGVFDIITNIQTGATMNRDKNTGQYYIAQRTIADPVYPIATAVKQAQSEGAQTVSWFVDNAGQAVTAKVSDVAAALAAVTNPTNNNSQLPVSEPLQQNSTNSLLASALSPLSAGNSNQNIEQYIVLGGLLLILSSIFSIFRRD